MQNREDTADVVIVGAGVVGASIAFHLAESGSCNVILLDEETPGAGATSKATGGIRQQFSSEVNVRLSQESLAFFERFEERIGCSLDLRHAGYLFVTDDPRRAEVLQRSSELQRRLGVDVADLSAEEVRELIPGIVADALACATYTADDAIASPADACYGLVSAAQRLGVQLHAHERVVSVRQRAGRIVGVITERAVIHAPHVVIAAGAGTAELCASAGLDLPIALHHRQAFVTEAGALPYSPRIPFVVDLDTGAYFHQEPSGAFVLGGTDHGDSSTEQGVNWQLLPHLAECIGARMPTLVDVGIHSGWAGFRDMTPDETAIVGKVDPIDGLYCAVGFSGHGFMHAPAVGRIVAELVRGETPREVDLELLSPSRFSIAPHAAATTREMQTF